MHTDLGIVRELQDLDRRIAELTREINYLPKHIAEIESKLQSHRRQVEADRAALTANMKERKSLEDDVKVQEEKVARLRDQMSEAKTNEQYRAFQHEIDFGQNEIRKIEDRILDRMGEAEALEKHLKLAEAALKQETVEVEKEKKAAEQRTEVDRVELAEAQARRAAAAQVLTPQTLTLYERIGKQRGGLAVSEARDGRCTTCNVILRLHFYHQVRSNDEVLTCEACGRILFYLPPEESPKEMADCRLQSAERLP